MTIPSRRPVTKGLRELLETATGKPIGVLRTPIVGGESVDPPYAVIFPEKGGRFAGPPFTAPNADAWFPYHVKSVGGTSEQAEWMSDAVRQAILERNPNGSFVETLTISGLSVMDRQPGLDSTGEVRQTGTIAEVDDFYFIVVTAS